MAAEVSSSGITYPANSTRDLYMDDGSEPDAGDLQKIISFRDTILAGKHPKFKPPPINSRQGVQAPMAPSTEQTAKETASPQAVARLLHRPAASITQASTAGESQIENVLLEKSDVLMKAETTFRRQRIEKLVRHQLEQRKMDSRLGLDVRDGRVISEEDFDLEEAMEKAGIHLKPVDRPDDPASANKLTPFYGTDDSNNRSKEQRPAPAPALAPAALSAPASAQLPPPLPSQPQPQPQPQAQAQAQSQAVQTAQTAPSTERMPEERVDHRQFGTPTGQRSTHGPLTTRAPETAHTRASESSTANPSSRDGRAPPPSSASFGREHSTSHPEQPRYSATSQVRSPAAPQPVRPANMARVESHEVIDVDNYSYVGGYQNRERSSPRMRGSSPMRIKQEPMSPYPREFFDERRPFTPEHYRRSVYDPRPPPPREYSYGPPPPSFAPSPHPYEAYPYRDERYAYPPPAEYRRHYPAPYSLPLISGPPIQHEYGPPSHMRPVYEEYPPRGYFRPPPPPFMRPLSVARRSASPPDYKRQRRDSRSVSPARERPVPPPPTAQRSASPAIRDRGPPNASGPASPAPVLEYGRERGEPERLPPPQQPPPPSLERPPPQLLYPAGSEVGYHYQGMPRERVHYYDRDPYYAPRPLPPAPRYPEDPIMSRPESSVIPRDDYRTYRERDYLPPPGSRPLSSSVPPAGVPYPPRDVYSRAPSVVPGMHTPLERGDYLPPPPQGYYRHADDFRGREAMRSDERPPYRLQNIVPEGEFYREHVPPPAGYKAGSVRPSGAYSDRERYETPVYGGSNGPPPSQPPPPLGQPPAPPGAYGAGHRPRN